MRCSAEERLEKLGLFNVSEVAREVGIDIQQLHRDVRHGRVPTPSIMIGKRRYFTTDDLAVIAKLYDVDV